MANRGIDWFRQAENDLLWAEDTLKAKRYAQVCYVAQQVAEKALKAYALYLEYDEIRSHAVARICKALNINGDIEEMGMKLDLYYVSARYPDAFPEGAPFEYFTESQAQEAYGFAEIILNKVQEKIDAIGS